MKLAFVCQRYGAGILGGAESACRHLARGMAAGAEVSVLTTCATDLTWANRLPAGDEDDGGVRVTRFPTRSPRDPGFERMSRRIFQHPDPPRPMQEEWVRAQGPDSPELIDQIRARAGEPDIWIFYTYLYAPTLFGLPHVSSKALLHPALHNEPPARLPIVREVIRSAAALSLQTEAEWELTLRFAGWPTSMVRMIGMGVEEGSGDPQAFRERFGLGADPFLLYLGRVDRGKGTDALVKAFSGFKSRHPGPLKLVVAGPVVHQPPSHDDVVVTGAVADADRWGALEACEIFVQPSPHESFAISLLEAWTKGKPAVVNAHCQATSGHASRSKGGLAYRDPAEFEAALEVLLGDQKGAGRLGENGRAYAGGFAWQVVLARYRTFLEELLRKSFSPPRNAPPHFKRLPQAPTRP